jgi:crotonobetainyl-CoA:carnitine CoA-transferase CaiB-like acyl-CoA transferase
MQKPMTGVRVLEVAQFTFVPSAGAVLAEWGADVIKVENPVTRDAQRGLVTVAGHSATAPGISFSPMFEAPNRGKRSVGLSLALSRSRPVFEELVSIPGRCAGPPWRRENGPAFVRDPVISLMP